MATDELKYPPGPYEIDPGDNGDDSVGLAPTPPSIVSADGDDLCILITLYEPYPEDHDPFEDGAAQGEITGHWILFERSPEMAEIVRRLDEWTKGGGFWDDWELIAKDAAKLWAEMLEDAKGGDCG